MLEYRYDTQLLIEGTDLCEDADHDYFMENFQGDCLLAVGDAELSYEYTLESFGILCYPWRNL